MRPLERCFLIACSQVDWIGGDANMALYRAAGRSRIKNPSISEAGMYPSTLEYFLEAWTESPKCI